MNSISGNVSREVPSRDGAIPGRYPYIVAPMKGRASRVKAVASRAHRHGKGGGAGVGHG
jgi:hypothetical protein